jgi:hypothetical protein
MEYITKPSTTITILYTLSKRFKIVIQLYNDNLICHIIKNNNKSQENNNKKDNTYEHALWYSNEIISLPFELNDKFNESVSYKYDEYMGLGKSKYCLRETILSYSKYIYVTFCELIYTNNKLYTIKSYIQSSCDNKIKWFIKNNNPWLQAMTYPHDFIFIDISNKSAYIAKKSGIPIDKIEFNENGNLFTVTSHRFNNSDISTNTYQLDLIDNGIGNVSDKYVLKKINN